MNVTVPERDAAAVFAATDSVTVALPVPDDGLTDSQDTFEDALHVVFDVTLSDALDAAAVGDHEVGDTDNVGAAPCCVTLIVCGDAPGHPGVDSVTVPERADTLVFTAADNVIVAFPVADDGLTVNQDAFDDATHGVPDVTCTAKLAPAAGGDHEDCDIGTTPLHGLGTVAVTV